MQVSGVEDDSRALNIIIHKPTSNPHAKPMPILQANFIFADHIRCIIAKQRLAKGRIQARRMKMQRIAGKPCFYSSSYLLFINDAYSELVLLCNIGEGDGLWVI